MSRYGYRVLWTEEDQEFVGTCIEIPSLSWLAETQEAALTGIRNVVADVVQDLRANREPVPEPTSSHSDWS